VQVASALAVADYDHDLSRSAPTPTERARGEQPDVEQADALGVSSVRYAPVPSSAPPDGVLSITQVALGPDTATDALDALARRLSQGLRVWSAEPQK